MCIRDRRITVPVTIDFMCVSSYGASTVSCGKITIKKDLEESIEGRNVIVIEDIIDTGRTLRYLLQHSSLGIKHFITLRQWHRIACCSTTGWDNGYGIYRSHIWKYME